MARHGRFDVRGMSELLHSCSPPPEQARRHPDALTRCAARNPTEDSYATIQGHIVIQASWLSQGGIDPSRVVWRWLERSYLFDYFIILSPFFGFFGAIASQTAFYIQAE